MFNPCSIRTMASDDLPLVLSWRNHPEVRRYMFTQHEISLQEHESWFYKACQDPKRSLLIIEEGMQPLGYVQLNKVMRQGVADWGFYLRPDAPKGSGIKLGVVALNYAFEFLNLHKVCGQAVESNQRSINFHQRLGFTHEGILREHQPIDGVYHSLFCFGLLAREWKPDMCFKENGHGQDCH